MIGFSVITTTVTDPEILRILGRAEYFIYISGAIILLGSSGNVTFSLNENLWRTAEDLNIEKWKWHEGNTKLKKQKQVLADAITKEYRKEESKLPIFNVSESCIEFATWLQDNYSQNRTQGGKGMLPKGYMREDFTNNTFPISEIWRVFNSR